MILVLLIVAILIFLLIIMIKALNPNSKPIEFEFKISIRCFKLSFKTNEKSTPSSEDKLCFFI
ncbi:MAG: hypothetical protein Q4B63_11130 [Clostridium perfringens]|nr:hypothetical protein [Clostridium perfringens]